jgi:hypothetical protein
MRFKDDIKIQDVCNNVCDHLSEKYNFKKLDFDNIYNLKTGTFHESVKIYLMLYMLEFYLEVELLMRAKTEEIYPFYESNDIETFIIQSEQITRNINQGKISRKQIAKSNSIVKSLDMLMNLDENYCEHIVNKFLSKDEFVNLTNIGSFLKF